MKRPNLMPRFLTGFSFLLVFVPLVMQAQVITSPLQHIPLRKVIDLSKDADTWFPVLENQKLPKPHPGTDRKAAEETRSSLAAKFPEQASGVSGSRMAAANTPVLGRNFLGNAFNFFVPNDNDLAISNGGVVSSIGNTMILSKDLNTSQNYGSYTLHSLMHSSGTSFRRIRS